MAKLVWEPKISFGSLLSALTAIGAAIAFIWSASAQASDLRAQVKTIQQSEAEHGIRLNALEAIAAKLSENQAVLTAIVNERERLHAGGKP